MHILITGGLGYIGGRVANYLAKSGYKITLASRDINCPPNWLPNAKIVKINWCDVHQLIKICEDIDVVIHTAGLDSKSSIENPKLALEVNGLNTTRILEASIYSKVSRFIYLSTAHVYANPLIGIFTEESTPQNSHPYATSHLLGESSVLTAFRKKYIEGIVFRMSNAVGPPMNRNTNCWSLLVNDLCKQAIEKKILHLKSCGFQKRDFISIRTVEEIFSHFINLNVNQLGNGLFNIGSGKSISIFAMAQLIQSRYFNMFGRKLEIASYYSPAKRQTNLVFNVDKLIGTGFNITDNLNYEIDATLSSSDKFFKN